MLVWRVTLGIVILYFLLKSINKLQTVNACFIYKVVATIVFAAGYAFTKEMEITSVVFFIEMLIGFITISLSATTELKARYFDNIFILIAFIVSICANGIVYITTVFSLLAKENNWILGLVSTILMILPQLIHFWRLMNMLKSVAKMMILSILNILTLEFMLYLGLGVTTFSEKNITNFVDPGNSFDQIMLVVNMGMSDVIQFPGIKEGLLPNTEMILAYCIGNFVNFLIASFFVGYIVAEIHGLKNKANKNILCKVFK